MDAPTNSTNSLDTQSHPHTPNVLDACKTTRNQVKISAPPMCFDAYKTTRNQVKISATISAVGHQRTFKVLLYSLLEITHSNVQMPNSSAQTTVQQD